MDICNITVFSYTFKISQQKNIIHEFFIVLSTAHYMFVFLFSILPVQEVNLASYGEKYNYFYIFIVYLVYVCDCEEFILTGINH